LGEHAEDHVEVDVEVDGGGQDEVERADELGQALHKIGLSGRDAYLQKSLPIKL
jgi:hypothetical protein